MTFNRINEQANAPIFVLNSDLTFYEANRATTAIFATDNGALLGNPIDRFIQADAAQLEDLRAVLTDGYAVIRSTIGVNGSKRHLDIHANLIFVTGQPKIKAFVQDVSHRQRHVHELQRINKRLAYALESAGDAYMAIDETWNIVYLNAQAERTFQTCRDEILGTKLTDALPEAGSMLYKKLAAAYADNTDVAFDGYYPPTDRWFTVNALRYDDGICIYMRDITEQRWAEQALHDRKEYLRAILENVMDGIIVSDSEGMIELFNPAAEGMTGYKAEEVIGRNVDLLMTDEHRHGHDAYVKRYLHTGESKVVGTIRDVPALRKNGSTFPAELAITKMDLGTRTKFLASIRDVSERRKAEEELRNHRDHLEEVVAQRTHELSEARDQAQQADRAKSAFLANMSHELRTPLNAIIGYSEILMEDAKADSGDDLHDDLHKIHSSGKYLLALINDILDISKIEAGKLELLCKDFDIATMVRDVVAATTPLVQRNGNHLTVSCPDDVGVMISDEMRVRQCLLNLLSNAAKFTENGAITLSVSRESQGAGDWLALSVSDTGIGIAADQCTKLFSAFAQADAETSHKYGGTGLGLAISRRLCRMMGGDLTVVSQPGSGSTFTMRLPVAVS